MSTLSKKIDFAILISVENANPMVTRCVETVQEKTMTAMEKFRMFV